MIYTNWILFPAKIFWCYGNMYDINTCLCFVNYSFCPLPSMIGFKKSLKNSSWIYSLSTIWYTCKVISSINNYTEGKKVKQLVINNWFPICYLCSIRSYLLASAQCLTNMSIVWKWANGNRQEVKRNKLLFHLLRILISNAIQYQGR